MKRNLSVLFMAAALTVSSLACKLLNGNPSAPENDSPISNMYMANDPEGLNQTNVFAPTDAIYVFFDANQPKNGTNFEARWYVLNVPDQVDPNVPFTTSNYVYEGGSTTIHAFVQSSHEDGFLPSEWRVEIYMDGVKVGEQLFSIVE